MWILFVLLLVHSNKSFGQPVVTTFTVEFGDQSHCNTALDILQKSTKDHAEIYADVFACLPKGP